MSTIEEEINNGSAEAKKYPTLSLDLLPLTLRSRLGR